MPSSQLEDQGECRESATEAVLMNRLHHRGNIEPRTDQMVVLECGWRSKGF